MLELAESDDLLLKFATVTSNLVHLDSEFRRTGQSTIYGNYLSSLRCFTQNELQTIWQYLNNPINTGIWHFEGDYSRNAENNFLGYIEDVLPKKSDKYQHTLNDTEGTVHRQNRYSQEIRMDLKEILIFFYAYVSRKETDDKEILPQFLLGDELGDLVKRIDSTVFEERFEVALKIFTDEIYDSSHLPASLESDIIKIKNGHIYSKPYKRELKKIFKRRISVFALDIKSAAVIKSFIEYLGIVEEIKLIRYFSPAEKVFTPYIPYLKETFSSYVDNPDFNRSFGIAISEFEQGSYPHCINTIAILAEHILTQIYETIFREEMDEKLTIGKLFNEIQMMVKEIVAPDRPKVNIDYQSLFKDIEKIISGIGTVPSEETHKETLQVLRKFIHQQKTKNTYLKESIERSHTAETNTSIFPRKISSKIYELLRNRNAIAHKSKISIGNYEAVRSVYCCFTLYCWWRETVESVDWTKDREEVLTFLSEKSKLPNF